MAIKTLHGLVVALSCATVVGVGKSSTVVGGTSLSGDISISGSKKKFRKERKIDEDVPKQDLGDEVGELEDRENEEIPEELPEEGEGLNPPTEGASDPNSIQVPGSGVTGSPDPQAAGVPKAGT